MSTVDDLAERLLAASGDVRAALDFAASRQLIAVQGDLNGEYNGNAHLKEESTERGAISAGVAVFAP